jgi:hypothetical protein
MCFESVETYKSLSTYKLKKRCKKQKITYANFQVMQVAHFYKNGSILNIKDYKWSENQLTTGQ